MSTIDVYDTDNNVKDLATLKAKSKPGGLKERKKNQRRVINYRLGERSESQTMGLSLLI